MDEDQAPAIHGKQLRRVAQIKVAHAACRRSKQVPLVVCTPRTLVLHKESSVVQPMHVHKEMQAFEPFVDLLRAGIGIVGLKSPKILYRQWHSSEWPSSGSKEIYRVGKRRYGSYGVASKRNVDLAEVPGCQARQGIPRSREEACRYGVGGAVPHVQQSPGPRRSCNDAGHQEETVAQATSGVDWSYGRPARA